MDKDFFGTREHARSVFNDIKKKAASEVMHLVSSGQVETLADTGKVHHVESLCRIKKGVGPEIYRVNVDEYVQTLAAITVLNRNLIMLEEKFITEIEHFYSEKGASTA